MIYRVWERRGGRSRKGNFIPRGVKGDPPWRSEDPVEGERNTAWEDELNPGGVGRFYDGPQGKVQKIHNGWRAKELDMPFSDINPHGWILGVKRFFKFYRLCKEERVETTVVYVELL